jgi:putative addiction module killer protein
VSEFRDWFNEQTEKAKVQMDDRLSKIQDEGYFGDHKSVCDDDEVWELKWKNGRRVYFAYIPEKKILVLLGGNKNGQDKDIHKAKSLYKKYTS